MNGGLDFGARFVQKGKVCRHRLVGQPYRRCEISGRQVAWTGDVPICERFLTLQQLRKVTKFGKRGPEKSCGHPGEPENGRVIVTDIHFGSTVNFTCEEGHRLIGRPYRRCDISGMRVAWTGDVPISIQNGRKVAGRGPVYRPRDTVRFECDPGYTLSGSRQIQCRDEGIWDPPVPACTQMLLCPPPPVIVKGKHNAKPLAAFPSGTYVNYSCEPATCVSPEVENGRTNGVQPAYRPSDMVVFECDPGYTMNGSPETQCQDDGRWDPPVPVCERLKGSSLSNSFVLPA
ncbi:unnamed protein product [Caretta caretta]